MAKYVECEATCKDCIHYDICIFHHEGNENKKCVRFKSKADVVEVRHGEWFPSRNGINPIRCDKCNTPALFVQEQDGFGGYGFYRCSSNYCPYCGAKMDGR